MLRTVALRVALAIVLAAAFVKAPFPIAQRATGTDFHDREGLVASVGTGFGAFWASGGSNLPPELARVVRFWSVYHATKAIAAGLLLVVCVVSTVALARALGAPHPRGLARRASLTVATGVSSLVATIALVLTMANIQGAVAPFASLLPMVVEPSGSGTGPRAVAEAKRALQAHAGTGEALPAPARRMMDAFATYHLAMAVMALFAAAILVMLALRAWRTAAGGAQRGAAARVVLRASGTAFAAFALAMVVIAVANMGTAVDPAPALLASLEGGW